MLATRRSCCHWGLIEYSVRTDLWQVKVLLCKILLCWVSSDHNMLIGEPPLTQAGCLESLKTMYSESGSAAPSHLLEAGDAYSGHRSKEANQFQDFWKAGASGNSGGSRRNIGGQSREKRDREDDNRGKRDDKRRKDNRTGRDDQVQVS